MSAALVKCNDAPHTFVDDLESIFYVILWLVLMYSLNSMMAEVRTSFMQQVVDPVQYAGTGGCAKADFLQGRSALRDLELHNPNRPELQTLLLNLATLFSVHYEPKPDQAADSKNVRPKREDLARSNVKTSGRRLRDSNPGWAVNPNRISSAAP